MKIFNAIVLFMLIAIFSVEVLDEKRPFWLMILLLFIVLNLIDILT